ncbi:QRFP-like peptide receptor, partial [Stegodyphus dumicola]|uniref:QRFP-like peptide receptor n=1 Tax=Stegodyphus dumicola TaxID=202533 RepID=UPI0015B2FB41
MTEVVEELSVDEVDQCAFELNFSHYEFPNPTALSEPLMWKEYIKIVFYAIVLIVALAGNISVILTVVLNRSMRTTINLYLVNLAVADLLICLCCMWVPLANSITKPMYSLGIFVCKLNPFAQMTCLTSSVLTLSAISCDRFIAIIFPLHVRITKQRTSVVISIIWLVSMAVSIPFLFIQKYDVFQWKDIAEPSCHDDWPREERWDTTLGICIRSYPMKQLYYTFVTITLFFLPVAIMITAYLLIIWRLWRSQAPGERNIANMNVQHRAKKKVIKMVCVVLCGFVICWSPMQVTVLYSQFGHSASQYGEVGQIIISKVVRHF